MAESERSDESWDPISDGSTDDDDDEAVPEEEAERELVDDDAEAS